jgi:flagellar biosynthesis chaperone FliJ
MEHENFDVVKKTEELYEHLGDDLSLEKLISYKLDINIISNECKKHTIFIDSKDKYDKFVTELEDEVTDNNKKLIAAWNHMDNRLSESPTSLHFMGSVILTIPVIDYVLQKYF